MEVIPKVVCVLKVNYLINEKVYKIVILKQVQSVVLEGANLLAMKVVGLNNLVYVKIFVSNKTINNCDKTILKMVTNYEPLNIWVPAISHTVIGYQQKIVDVDYILVIKLVFFCKVEDKICLNEKIIVEDVMIILAAKRSIENLMQEIMNRVCI